MTTGIYSPVTCAGCGRPINEPTFMWNGVGMYHNDCAPRGNVVLPQQPGLTLDANEVRFLAARLRRLFQHFGTPIPEDAARDDARLIGVAGAAIGLLLTNRTDGVTGGQHQTKSPSGVDGGDRT